MRKALLVIPDLDYSGAARQLTLLALGLPRAGLEPTVCVLGPEGPLAPALRTGGVRVEALGSRGRFDPGMLFRLRRLLAELRPDVMHAWRPRSVRSLALAGCTGTRPLLVSHPFQAGRGSPAPRWFDRWLLRRADCVLASGPAEADRCRQLGLAGTRLAVVPPGVEAGVRSQESDDRAARSASKDLAAGADGRGENRFLLCVGPLEPHKGYRDAIWACDVLRRLYPGLRLLLAGSGTDRPHLERFTAAIRMGEHVRFVGAPDDLAGLLARAEVVWVPSRADAGANVALEAMAAGLPVVAAQVPGLAEIVADGDTGFLVPPGDRTALARRTRLLLEDDGRRRALGAAGRRRVVLHFPAAAQVERVAGLYRELAA